MATTVARYSLTGISAANTRPANGKNERKALQQPRVVDSGWPFTLRHLLPGTHVSRLWRGTRRPTSPTAAFVVQYRGDTIGTLDCAWDFIHLPGFDYSATRLQWCSCNYGFRLAFGTQCDAVIFLCAESASDSDINCSQQNCYRQLFFVPQR